MYITKIDEKTFMNPRIKSCYLVKVLLGAPLYLVEYIE